MPRHSWSIEKNNKIEKVMVCKKCGIYKEWHGGDYQSWYYYSVKILNNEYVRNGSYKRPECKTILNSKE